MSPTVFTKYTIQQEVTWQQYRLYLVTAAHQILGGKHVPYFGIRIRKDSVFLKRFNTFRRNTIANGPSCDARQATQVFFFLLMFAVLGDWKSKAKVISIESPQYRHSTLIIDFLDLVNLSMREEAILATNWIKDRPEGLKASEPCIGDYDRPSDEQFTEKYDCRCSVCH